MDSERLRSIVNGLLMEKIDELRDMNRENGIDGHPNVQEQMDEMEEALQYFNRYYRKLWSYDIIRNGV